MRKIEVFVSGCHLCEEAVELVRQLACPSCAIEVRDMALPETQRAARALGVRNVPAVVVDGRLLDCCRGGIDEAALTAAGIGTPIP